MNTHDLVLGTSSDGEPIAPDGSPVSLLAEFPAGRDGTVIDRFLRPRNTIIELGCGAGRLINPLAARGHYAVGVDISAEMLARLRGPRAVCEDITTCSLDEQFHLVLLASHLLNTCSSADAAAFLRSCRHHVRDDGRVLVQLTDPEWCRALSPGDSWSNGGFDREILSVTRLGPEEFEIQMCYRKGDRVWTSRWRDRLVSAADFAAMADDAGLRLSDDLTGAPDWFCLVPRRTDR